MKLLRDFWDKQGRILLLLDPAAKTPKLHAFLHELGVKVNDDRLMANVQDRHPGGRAPARCDRPISLPDSPITKRLADARAHFSRRDRFDHARPADQCAAAIIQLQPLVQAEKGYWGEMDYNSDDETVLQFTPDRDHDAPLNIAVSVEKGGSGDERVQANSSRMVVVSNATFAQDSALYARASRVSISFPAA